MRSTTYDGWKLRSDLDDYDGGFEPEPEGEEEPHLCMECGCAISEGADVCSECAIHDALVEQQVNRALEEGL